MNKVNFTTPGPMELQAADGAVHAAEHYSRTPTEVIFNPALSMGARVCYTALMSFAIHSNKVWPGQQRLASDLGVTTRMIRNYIDELRLHELLTITSRKGQKTNVYTLTVFVESKDFQAFDHAGNRISDRKNISGHSASDRKYISGHSESDRKYISSKNNKDFPNYETLNKNKKIEKPNLVNERFQAKIEKGVAQDIADMQRLKSLEKLDAYCKAVGMNRAHLTGRPLARAIEALTDSPMPTDDIPFVIEYLKTDAFFGLHLDRLTVKAVVDRWPLWVAAGRPWTTTPKTPAGNRANGKQSAQNVDQRLQEINQQIADERGEVYEGVQPSYWSTGYAGSPEPAWAESMDHLEWGLDFIANNGNVGVRSHD